MSRTKHGRQWIRRHLSDPFVKQANREGYRSRAAYKLIEIDDRDRLLRAGATVLDLGSAPGGWSQVCAERVRPGGHVIAVDVLAMAPVPGVSFVQGDMLAAETLDRVRALLPGGVSDLVISDMAPNLTGIRAADDARAEALVEIAVEIAVHLLKPPGGLLVKVFHGASFDRGLKELRSHFGAVVVRKPAASRSSSSETYLLARGLLKR
ncbi:MAG: RlmE family RNA methyltransferase [Burkholderiales bacterium]|nr:RlmE family RNA methyltransferase [Burkholderiales bacterium]